MSDTERSILSTLDKVASIVSAYVSYNSLRAADLPDLIASVHSALSNLVQETNAPEVKATETPAIAIKKSVTQDYIVCLEDGKKFKSLRRHLSSFHNLTPDEYRTKWQLPSDYPMVAPAYSATRSQLAKNSGLGQIDKVGSEGVQMIVKPEVETAPLKKPGRGRPRKTAV